MKYKILVGPVEICSITFEVDKALLDDEAQLTEEQIDLIIKDGLMTNIRASKEESHKQLLEIIQDAFDMFASLEFNKRQKGEFKEPTTEELKEVYMEFMKNHLKLNPVYDDNTSSNKKG